MSWLPGEQFEGSSWPRHSTGTVDKDSLCPHEAVLNVHSLDEGGVHKTHPLLGVRVVVFDTDLQPGWGQAQCTSCDTSHTATLQMNSTSCTITPPHRLYHAEQLGIPECNDQMH